MSAKIHIVDSLEPLKPHGDFVETRCGVAVFKPQISFMWDEQAMGEPLNLPLGCCRKCLRVEDPKSRYSYGVKV